MKKAIYTILFLGAANPLQAHGVLNKVKSKVHKANEGSAASIRSNFVTGIKYTDPAKYGTLIKTYSKKEVENAMGGESGGSFNLWFQSVKVVNNQLQLKIADYSQAIYNYTNGQLQKSGEKSNESLRNKLINGSEKDLRSIDFTQTDQSNTMLKKGGHVAGAMIPGKVGQTYTFNGKTIGTFSTASLAHNADSTVVVAVSMTYNKGISYNLITSNGQHLSLPAKYGGIPLISPNGKVSAAAFQSANGTDIYLSNGSKVAIKSYDNNNGLWLRNSGSVFYTDNSKAHNLYKNGAVYHSFEMPINTKMLFISNDDKTMCWEIPHAICFSDGTIFENAESPNKVMINGKEVIIFLAVNVQTGKLYLCQHTL